VSRRGLCAEAGALMLCVADSDLDWASTIFHFGAHFSGYFLNRYFQASRCGSSLRGFDNPIRQFFSPDWDDRHTKNRPQVSSQRHPST
jgi:hypothetical protein